MATETTEMPLSDVNDLDAVVHELGIEDADTTPAEAVQELKREIDNLRALVSRITNVADDLARAVADPGAEALAAIHCGRNFIYG